MGAAQFLTECGKRETFLEELRVFLATQTQKGPCAHAPLLLWGRHLTRGKGGDSRTRLFTCAVRIAVP